MESEIYLLVVLIVLSGIFSGGEIAFFSITKARVHALVEQRRRNAALLEKLKSDPQRLLISISIADNLVDIGASSLATIVATEAFGSVGVGISVGVMTFLILFFGEIVPKSISQKHAEPIALFLAPWFRLLVILLTPAAWMMSKLNSGFQKLVGVHEGGNKISEDEVRAMLHLGHVEGVVEQDEKDMIEKVFQLNDITVEDVMTPEEYIVGFNIDTTIGEALPIIEGSGHSRFPVYSTDDDEIEGFVYLKDVFSLVVSRESEQKNVRVTDTKISDLMKPPMFVPETMLVDDLMREFQKRRVHIAAVVDEHGSVEGLVTLEDLLEEIVGEIIDETDTSSELMERIDVNTLLVDPRVTIGRVNAMFKSHLKGSKQKSIGWLLLKEFGRIPDKGDSLTIDDYKFIITEAEEHRIRKIQIIRTAKAKSRLK